MSLNQPAQTRRFDYPFNPLSPGRYRSKRSLQNGNSCSLPCRLISVPRAKAPQILRIKSIKRRKSRFAQRILGSVDGHTKGISDAASAVPNYVAELGSLTEPEGAIVPDFGSPAGNANLLKFHGPMSQTLMSRNNQRPQRPPLSQNGRRNHQLLWATKCEESPDHS